MQQVHHILRAQKLTESSCSNAKVHSMLSKLLTYKAQLSNSPHALTFLKQLSHLCIKTYQTKKQSCSCQCSRWRCVNEKNIVDRVKGIWCHAAARCNIPITLLLLKPQILLKKPNHFKANTYSAETTSIPSKLTTVIMLLICAQPMSGLNRGANTYSPKWQLSL